MGTDWSLEPAAAADEVLSFVYRERYGQLVGLAFLLVGDRGLAEEVVQEAFARTLEAWGRLRRPDDPFFYVRRVVVNLARSAIRRRVFGRRQTADVTRHNPGADETVVADESRREVMRALAGLPRRQRECVVLRYFEECSTEETAAALGVSPSAVKTHLQRALQALERTLGGTR
jgi:RNA polymerase sigma-70 factor (sigma-E family)